MKLVIIPWWNSWWRPLFHSFEDAVFVFSCQFSFVGPDTDGGHFVFFFEKKVTAVWRRRDRGHHKQTMVYFATAYICIAFLLDENLSCFNKVLLVAREGKKWRTFIVTNMWLLRCAGKSNSRSQDRHTWLPGRPRPDSHVQHISPRLHPAYCFCRFRVRFY